MIPQVQMRSEQMERRTYDLPALALFGAGLTALAQLDAEIERQDAERGTIVARIGRTSRAPGHTLAVTVRPVGDGRAALVAEWQGRSRGGRRLAPFFEALEMLIGPAGPN
jgi:hypothetical protein